jgi:hypothetical protein
VSAVEEELKQVAFCNRVPTQTVFHDVTWLRREYIPITSRSSEGRVVADEKLN